MMTPRRLLLLQLLEGSELMAGGGSRLMMGACRLIMQPPHWTTTLSGSYQSPDSPRLPLPLLLTVTATPLSLLSLLLSAAAALCSVQPRTPSLPASQHSPPPQAPALLGQHCLPSAAAQRGDMRGLSPPPLSSLRLLSSFSSLLCAGLAGPHSHSLLTSLFQPHQQATARPWSAAATSPTSPALCPAVTVRGLPSVLTCLSYPPSSLCSCSPGASSSTPHPFSASSYAQLQVPHCALQHLHMPPPRTRVRDMMDGSAGWMRMDGGACVMTTSFPPVSTSLTSSAAAAGKINDSSSWPTCCAHLSSNSSTRCTGVHAIR